MIEYLEIILLITAIIVVFRQTHEKIKDIENQSKDIEDKLEATYKLLKELQPKGPVEIPARLDDEVVNVIMDVTKQDMDKYQVEKAEFQKIKKKYETEAMKQQLLKEQGDLITFKEKQRKLLEDMMSVDEKLGLYDKDDIEEMKIWDSTLMDGMNDIQYEGTEYGGPDRLTREQAQEILENIKYRKANRLT